MRLLILEGGGVRRVLRPAADPLEEMEAALGAVYGPGSLHRVAGRDGRPRLVMLKETDGEEDGPCGL